jgi:hypothetical protein
MLAPSHTPCRFGLLVEPINLHIKYETYPDYSRFWKLSLLFCMHYWHLHKEKFIVGVPQFAGALRKSVTVHIHTLVKK